MMIGSHPETEMEQVSLRNGKIKNQGCTEFFLPYSLLGDQIKKRRQNDAGHTLIC